MDLHTCSVAEAGILKVLRQLENCCTLKNRGGLVDFHDVMDVVYMMTRIGMNNCTLHVLSCHPRVSKPRPLRHENQPGLPDFTACNVEKYGEAWIRG